MKLKIFISARALRRRTSLMDLPVEIRLIIYDALVWSVFESRLREERFTKYPEERWRFPVYCKVWVGDSGPDLHSRLTYYQPGSNLKNCLAILRTCRLIHKEAVEVVYGYASFIFEVCQVRDWTPRKLPQWFGLRRISQGLGFSTQEPLQVNLRGRPNGLNVELIRHARVVGTNTRKPGKDDCLTTTQRFVKVMDLLQWGAHIVDGFTIELDRYINPGLDVSVLSNLKSPRDVTTIYFHNPFCDVTWLRPFRESVPDFRHKAALGSLYKSLDCEVAIVALACGGRSYFANARFVLEVKSSKARQHQGIHGQEEPRAIDWVLYKRVPSGADEQLFWERQPGVIGGTLITTWL